MLKIWPLVKDPQFSSDQTDIQAILPIQELVILIKFHKNWQEIADIFSNSEILSLSIF